MRRSDTQTPPKRVKERLPTGKFQSQGTPKGFGQTAASGGSQVLFYVSLPRKGFSTESETVKEKRRFDGDAAINVLSHYQDLKSISMTFLAKKKKKKSKWTMYLFIFLGGFSITER